ncbi:hypothetical protein L6654_19640 [Bradyrhizobium sp. WYCCWR 13023]|uniref:Uncharacterized protein n=1 Tax=Bradyrhizobium zhengyangense TaxID=2911009 RepID=A0A9X1R7Q6_9BRAD|nr:hypothetical protein [Bradyrhizobium zhengyangense]MCG2628852.1 hypothetical protein [Bradyrhizobium zhengyangense]
MAKAKIKTTANASAKAQTKTAANDNEVSPFAIDRALTLGEKVALASASLSIQRLPLCLQQASNAYDMQAMLVKPSSVWRGVYILAQAEGIFESYSGWQPASIGDGSDLNPKTRAALEAFVKEAIKAHQAEIAEGEAWAASPEGKAALARMKSA